MITANSSYTVTVIIECVCLLVERAQTNLTQICVEIPLNTTVQYKVQVERDLSEMSTKFGFVLAEPRSTCTKSREK